MCSDLTRLILLKLCLWCCKRHLVEAARLTSRNQRLHQSTGTHQTRPGDRLRRSQCTRAFPPQVAADFNPRGPYSVIPPENVTGKSSNDEKRMIGVLQKHPRSTHLRHLLPPAVTHPPEHLDLSWTSRAAALPKENRQQLRPANIRNLSLSRCPMKQAREPRTNPFTTDSSSAQQNTPPLATESFRELAASPARPSSTPLAGTTDRPEWQAGRAVCP